METVEERNNLLDMKVGDMTFREMTRITFNQYVLKKVDGLKTFNYKVQELVMSCNPSPARFMDDEEKLQKLKKLKELELTIP
jgi:hypothetical protein